MKYTEFLTRFLLVTSIAGIVGLAGCNDDNDNNNNSDIEFVIPPGFPQPVYQFTDNAVTNERFELGKKLFYDPLLSVDNSVSCASCHLQEAAFSHVDHDLSHGINNLLGTRNAPPIFNMAWHSNFFWDGGVNHLELQPVNPIQNPVEMGETISNVILKLNSSSTYRSLFQTAYGSDSVTSQLMLRAMAQFMAVMVSSNSRYDKYIRGEDGVTFTSAELNGLNLFRQKCASCHTEPLMTDLTYKSNGLDSTVTDPGRGGITQDPSDMGKFKVPSLRNVAVSNPYMHDGRIKTLEKVLEHYNSGVKNAPNLDPSLAGGIPLTAQEKSDLISFLQTLTDEEFLHNPLFADPNP